MGHAEFIDGGQTLVRVSERGATDIVDAQSGEGVRVLPPLFDAAVRDLRERTSVVENGIVIAAPNGDLFRGSLDTGLWTRVIEAPPFGRIRGSKVAARGDVVAAAHERSFDYKADDAVLVIGGSRGQQLVSLGEWVEVLAICVSADRVECLLASHRWEHVRYLGVDLDGVVREEADVRTEGAPHLARFVGPNEFVLLSGDPEQTQVSLHSLSNLDGQRVLRVPEDVSRFARTFAVRRTLDGRLQITTFSNRQFQLLTLHGERVVARESMPVDGVFRAALSEQSDAVYLDAIVKSDSDVRALGERSGICVVAKANAGEEEAMSPSSYFPPRILVLS